MNGFRLMSVVSVIVLLGQAGCASQPKAVEEPDQVQLKVSEAVTQVSKSMATLAQVEQASRGIYAANDRATPPPGMDKIVSVNWSGQLETIVRKMAERAGYKFKVVGKPPHIPILVGIKSKDVSIFEVIRNVSYQANSAADVNIKVDPKVVELTYPN